MKRLTLITAPLVVLLVGFLAGCEIITEEPPPPVLKTSNTLVINEVFILPPPNQAAHHWIEFYNPTPRAVRLSTWKLGFKTTRTWYAADDSGRVLAGGFDTTLAYNEVALKSGGTVGPYEFFTMVSNEERMKNYTTWGPGRGKTLQVQTFAVVDTLAPDSIVNSFYPFSLLHTDQLVLKDSAGNTVDVVRYGGYRHPGPGSDPYAANVSLGPIVPYQSFCRYAGAYKTGSYSSSVEDFYITGVQVPLTRPIPHWLSQAYKQ